MKLAQFKPLIHRSRECIGIYFENDSALNNIIRKVAIAKWSRTHKCWWMPLTKENYNQLFSVLQREVKIENAALRLYLTNKKRKNTNELTQKIKDEKHNRQLPDVTKSQTTIYKTACISSINAHVLPAMEQQMKLIEIDSRRMQILISSAKGKKDRYVNLSPVTCI